MSGLLVLAEYAGQVNELTVDGWEDVMDDVITATQMFTPLGEGTVDDAKLQQAGGSTAVPQTPAALETATPASAEESMETATPASGSDAMETATPASAEESSDQSYHVAKKWIGNQMLNSNCAVISQIAGAGKSEFLVAAAAWMEEMAIQEQEETFVGEGHLGAVASSTHEKPTFFVCSPSNLQTDDLEAKFKNIFRHAAVQRMGIDGDGQWPRDYFDDLLTGAMTTIVFPHPSTRSCSSAQTFCGLRRGFLLHRRW